MRFAFNRPLSEAGLITSTRFLVEVFYFGLRFLEDNRMNEKNILLDLIEAGPWRRIGFLKDRRIETKD